MVFGVDKLLDMSKQDGHVVKVTEPKALEHGTVLRMVNSDGSVAPFSDYIVINVKYGQIHMVRPYAMQKYELFVASFDRVMSHFRLVTLASGKPYIVSAE